MTPFLIWQFATSKIGKYLLAATIILAAFGGSYFKGHHEGYKSAQMKCDEAFAEARLEQDKANLKIREEYNKSVRQYQAALELANTESVDALAAEAERNALYTDYLKTLYSKPVEQACALDATDLKAMQ
jgi:hypothetical protein